MKISMEQRFKLAKELDKIRKKYDLDKIESASLLSSAALLNGYYRDAEVYCPFDSKEKEETKF